MKWSDFNVVCMQHYFFIQGSLDSPASASLSNLAQNMPV